MLSDNRCSIGLFLSTPTVMQYVAEYRKISQDSIYTSNASFAGAISQAREWEMQGVEVFISRRATGDMLRKNMSLPVLSLPLSEMEIIRCLRERCGKGDRVLIPMYKDEYPGLELLPELLGISISQRLYRNQQELEQLLQSVLEDYDFVAGGTATERLAKEYGVPYIELAPSKEQVFTILESARNVVLSNREKATMLQEMDCIMNSMAEGVLSVDRAGNILSCNEAALEFLQGKKAADIIGSSFFAYVDYEAFQSMLQGSQTRYEKIVDIDETSLVVNVSLIKSKRSVERLLVTLRRAQDVIRQSGTIRSAISKGFEANYRLSDTVYKSRPMRNIMELCRAYAKTNSSILICGETGTGKEMLAQGIHNRSSRHKNPFVSVNCAELPEHLLESELFGYDEGAFTGSRKSGKQGFFELAHGGTLLLDEIDSASNSVQSKLLRVLQEKEIMRIGGKRKIPVDVRVLATSGRDLWEQVRVGDFRKDLFFRLNVMSIHIPPLRDRIEDIDILLPYFLGYFSQVQDIPVPSLSPEQVILLKEYSWPGNVRQLRHFAERFVLYSSFMEEPFFPLYKEIQAIVETEFFDIAPPPDPGIFSETEMSAELPSEGRSKGFRLSHGKFQDSSAIRDLLSNSRKTLDDPDTLQMVLEHARYSKKEAARILGVSRSTLWRKLKQYNLE